MYSSYGYYGQQNGWQQAGGILWVQGSAGAKSYPVAPNCTVLLMDSENPMIYVKSADGAGMPTLKAYKYSEVKEAEPATTDLTDINGKIDALRADVTALQEALKHE